MKFLYSIVFTILVTTVHAQMNSYWQQSANYKMTIDFDDKKHQYKGDQTIVYTNNSPDTLEKVFYHLYFNAFQPNSMMDVRSRTISDPDSRIGDRILSLNEGEQGYQKVNKLTHNGSEVEYEIVGTILEVKLTEPILPGKKAVFKMNFEAQVPVQIRRSGRNSAEGISYSMVQWYPKLCEYDDMGWHANPYIAREFYGIWGDFDVTIAIDRKYTVAASGVLQNKEKMGHGYSDIDTRNRPFLGKRKLKWRFIAEDVHDFFWAADPEYTHDIQITDQGTELHYFYDAENANVEAWQQLHRAMNAAEKFMNKRYGRYPYPVYSFVQGGDGGMEYAMGTLITGKRKYSSLVGVSIHEWMHSWYQMVLGTNEALYAWMDEGFTSFGTAEVMNHLRKLNIIPGEYSENPLANTLQGYGRFSQSGLEEPLSTHADHFNTNRAYGAAAYTKGSTFLAQLEYILGDEAFAKSLLRYFDDWKFKHPRPNDFIRICEKESGLELDWYKEYMVYTTRTIDYQIDSVFAGNKKSTVINLSNAGEMPFPQDVTVELNNGNIYQYNIALQIMRGNKADDRFEFANLPDWPWTHKEYSFTVPFKLAEIKRVELDAYQRTADINRDNNKWEAK